MFKVLNTTKKEVILSKLDEVLKEDVEAIKQGEFTICPKWENVENLLECFPEEENEEWRIEKLSNGMFAVLPKNTTTFQKNQFEKLLKE